MKYPFAKRFSAFLALTFAAVLLSLTLTPLVSGTEPLDTKPVEGGGGGTNCSYCSTSLCGCASPTAGCTLQAECTCNSTTCTVTCSYFCS